MTAAAINRKPEISHIDKWMDAHCRQHLSDPPEQARTVEHPTTFAISIDRIIPWNTSNIRRKLEELHYLGEIRVAFSVSLSLFHTESKQFYGSTFVGHDHVVTLKNLKEFDTLSMNNLNELVYFQTRVIDPNSVVVCELVASLFDQFGEGIERRYGCGFAIINPFCVDEDASITENLKQRPIKSGITFVYDGSPRDLLGLKEPSGALEQLRTSKRDTKSAVSYKIWQCNGITTVESFVKENQIIGALTKVPGLAATTVDCFDDRGRSELRCIGAKTTGSILDWTLSPVDKLNLGRVRLFHITNMVFTIPNRDGFEEACCQWVANTHPRNHEGVLGRMSGILRNCSSPIKSNRCSVTVASRRLRVGTHNGHTFMKWVVIDLEQNANSDTMEVNMPIEVSGFRDEDFSIVFLLEYTVSEERSDGRFIKSPTKPPPESFTVTVGTTVLSPVNKESKGDVSEVISLDLINDARCSYFSSNTVFSPSNAPTCSLSFHIIEGHEHVDEANQPKTLVGLQHSHPFQLDSVSLDGSSTSLFVKRKLPVERDEAKEDFESFPDISTLTFDETLIEEKDSTCEAVAEKTRRKVVASATSGYRKPSEYSLLTEVDDTNNLTDVTIKLLSFTRAEKIGNPTQHMPRFLSFQFKLCENDEVITEPFPLMSTKFSEQSKVSFEYAYTKDKAKRLATYLLERSLFIEVFDDSKFHIGTIALPMHLLVRQGQPSRSLDNISVDVISPPNTSDMEVVKVEEGILASGETTGSISLSIVLQGHETRPPVEKHSCSHHSVTRRHALNLLDTNADLRRLVSRVKGITETKNCIHEKLDENYAKGTHSIKHQQLVAVEAYRQQYHSREDKVESLLSFAKDITPQGPNHQEHLLVNAAQLVREEVKKDFIEAHIASANKSKVVRVKPLLGQSLLIEIEVRNPMSTDESFVIHSNHPGLRLVTTAPEWDIKRRGYGAYVLSGREALVQFDCMKDIEVNMKAHQSLVLPILLDQRTTNKERVTFSLVSRNCVTDSFEIDVMPLVQIDRRFIVHCRYNESIKRQFSFRPKDTSNRNTLSIKVIDEANLGVQCEWSQSSRNSSEDSVYDLKLEARACDNSSAKACYIVISNDHFTSVLECWKVTFEARCPLYDTVCLGASVRKEIAAKIDDEEDRVVNCRAMILPNGPETRVHTSVCKFEQTQFQLMANKVNRFHVLFRPQSAGNWHVLLNCIDESGKLILSYILSVRCYLPVLSKVN